MLHMGKVTILYIYNWFWTPSLPGSKQMQSVGAWAWSSPYCQLGYSRFSVDCSILLTPMSSQVDDFFRLSAQYSWHQYSVDWMNGCFQPIFWFSSMNSSLCWSSREANKHKQRPDISLAVDKNYSLSCNCSVVLWFPLLLTKLLTPANYKLLTLANSKMLTQANSTATALVLVLPVAKRGHSLCDVSFLLKSTSMIKSVLGLHCTPDWEDNGITIF